MDKAPLLFEAKLGRLIPANRAAEEALHPCAGASEWRYAAELLISAGGACIGL